MKTKCCATVAEARGEVLRVAVEARERLRQLPHLLGGSVPAAASALAEVADVNQRLGRLSRRLLASAANAGPVPSSTTRTLEE